MPHAGIQAWGNLLCVVAVLPATDRMAHVEGEIVRDRHHCRCTRYMCGGVVLCGDLPGSTQVHAHTGLLSCSAAGGDCARSVLDGQFGRMNNSSGHPITMVGQPCQGGANVADHVHGDRDGSGMTTTDIVAEGPAWAEGHVHAKRGQCEAADESEKSGLVRAEESHTVAQTGTPGRIWPSTRARTMPRTSVAISLDVIPPLATTQAGAIRSEPAISHCSSLDTSNRQRSSGAVHIQVSRPSPPSTL